MVPRSFWSRQRHYLWLQYNCFTIFEQKSGKTLNKALFLLKIHVRRLFWRTGTAKNHSKCFSTSQRSNSFPKIQACAPKLLRKHAKWWKKHPKSKNEGGRKIGEFSARTQKKSFLKTVFFNRSEILLGIFDQGLGVRIAFFNKKLWHFQVSNLYIFFSLSLPLSLALFLTLSLLRHHRNRNFRVLYALQGYFQSFKTNCEQIAHRNWDLWWIPWGAKIW